LLFSFAAAITAAGIVSIAASSIHYWHRKAEGLPEASDAGFEGARFGAR
jgi:hypothetical protein